MGGKIIANYLIKMQNNNSQELALNRQRYGANRQKPMTENQAAGSGGGRLPESGQSKMASAQLGQEQNAARNAAQREVKNKQPEGGVSAPQAVNQVKESVSFLKSFAAFIEPTTAMVLTFWLFIKLLGVKRFIKGGSEEPFSKLRLAEIIVLALADIMWLAIVTLIIVLIYKILNGDFGFWAWIKIGTKMGWAWITGGSQTEVLIEEGAKSIVPE